MYVSWIYAAFSILSSLSLSLSLSPYESRVLPSPSPAVLSLSLSFSLRAPSLSLSLSPRVFFPGFSDRARPFPSPRGRRDVCRASRLHACTRGESAYRGRRVCRTLSTRSLSLHPPTTRSPVRLERSGSRSLAAAYRECVCVCVCVCVRARARGVVHGAQGRFYCSVPGLSVFCSVRSFW